MLSLEDYSLFFYAPGFLHTFPFRLLATENSIQATFLSETPIMFFPALEYFFLSFLNWSSNLS